MYALKGYYDGETIQLLEKNPAKKNQKLIIMVLDEFVSEEPVEKEHKTAKGALSKYADPNLWELEDSAWEKAVMKKYGNA